MKYLFVTGMHRSGTTLLEKLLHNHPGIAVASQPAPYLYPYLKQEFLNSLGIQRQYPLDHLMGETDYQTKDFREFLQQYELSTSFIQGLYTAMEGYSGVYSPSLLPYGYNFSPGKLIEVYKQIADLTAVLAPGKQVEYRGTKEVMAEEYIPYLLANQVKVLMVIRDPRDMLASTNSGSQMGEVRPTLHYLRQWRKSIAFALEMAGNSNYFCIRYEDLVTNPQESAARISGFLGVAPYPEDIWQQGLTDQEGKAWKGNSSFQEFSSIGSESVGRFRQSLSAEALRYVELTCYPEMQATGYAPTLITSADYSLENIMALQEPYEVKHRHFTQAYAQAPENIELEASRWRLLQQENPPAAAQRKYFIFDKAYQALRQVLLPGQGNLVANHFGRH